MKIGDMIRSLRFAAVAILFPVAAVDAQVDRIREVVLQEPDGTIGSDEPGATLGPSSSSFSVSSPAELAIVRGDYKTARRLLAPIARQRRKGTNSGLHQFNVARVSFAERDFRRAKRDCAAIKKLDGQAFWLHLCNARAFLTNRRPALAEAEITTAVQALGSRDFGTEHLHVAIASAELAGQKQERQAVVEVTGQHLSAAAQSELPNDASVPYLIVKLIIERAKNEASPQARIGCFKEALRRIPNHPDALLGLGIETADPKLLHQAERVRPGWTEPLRHLAEMLLKTGDTKGAFDAAKQVLKKERDDSVAVRVAALAAIELGDSSAWDRLGRALHLLPNDADLLMAEAALLHKRGEHEEALEKLERVAALQTTNPKPYLECAKIALATSRPKLAGGYLDQALMRDPQNKEAQALCKKTTCRAPMR